MPNAENWLAVIGYEGVYEVSDTGRVRSIDRIACNNQFRKGVVRKQFPQASGHLSVTLSKDGISRTVNVHKMVALAFLGPRPTGMFIRHGDGIETNNARYNLTYDTPQQNNLDRYIHGVSPTGDASHLARYTEVEVSKIWSLKGTMSSRLAAEKIGINARYIRRIWSREIRKHDARISN